jgi:hypothetical protein
MRIAPHMLWLCLGCLLASGCALVTDATRLVSYKTSETVENCRERSRDRKWAEESWANQCANFNEKPSKDYHDGFIDGFATYLYSGGNGEPPALAPKHYRKLGYQTPEGYQAMQDWFAGYRNGASVARDKGLREFVTGPSSLRSEGPPADAGGVIYETPDFKVMSSGHEELPPPRKVP